jgi:Lsr2
MTKESLSRVTDDIDGSEATEELTFALRGVEYAIDLNAKNAAALERALEKFVKAGRKVKRTPAPRRSGGRSAGTTSTKEDLSAIREWARANGLQVSSRGRLSHAVREAYQAAG